MWYTTKAVAKRGSKRSLKIEQQEISTKQKSKCENTNLVKRVYILNEGFYTAFIMKYLFSFVFRVAFIGEDDFYAGIEEGLFAHVLNTEHASKAQAVVLLSLRKRAFDCFNSFTRVFIASKSFFRKIAISESIVLVRSLLLTNNCLS